MKNKSTQSVLVLLVLFPILVMAISTPAQAMKISISPSQSLVNSTYAFSATMEPQSVPSGGFFFLNATIPAGYNFTFPATGKTIVNYTMFNNTAHSNQVIINITSNDSTVETVDVRYSTNYGLTYSTSTNQPINNIVIGVSTLKITKPGPSTPGYLNWSLGGTAGPILVQDKVIITLAEQVLWNPAHPGKYTWYLEAKNNPADTAYTAFDVVDVVNGTGMLTVTASPILVKVSIPANVVFTVKSGMMPVPGTSVNLTQGSIEIANGTTNASGQVTVSVHALNSGLIKVVASKESFNNGTAFMIAMQPMLGFMRLTASPTSIKVSTATNVTFRLTTFAGVPIDNASVILSGAGVNTNGTTNSTGYAVINNVNATTPGLVKAIASKSGFYNATTFLKAKP